MKIELDDAAVVIDAFFQLIDAHYGTSEHHIGDGDGIDKKTANGIRTVWKKYHREYWAEKNSK